MPQNIKKTVTLRDTAVSILDLSDQVLDSFVTNYLPLCTVEGCNNRTDTPYGIQIKVGHKHRALCEDHAQDHIIVVRSTAVDPSTVRKGLQNLERKRKIEDF